jgi:UDP-N-acetylmuramyl pentapeptide phosphotransferase/UDP-N-acetylglucosamine-1-phosphate transferase
MGPRKLLFPRAVDQHKPDKPLIPNGLGVIYVIASAVYLFLLYAYYYVHGSSSKTVDAAPLVLAVCILFGGFLGLLDDWISLRWRYKAFLPIFVALPLAVLVSLLPAHAHATSLHTYIFGTVNFGPWFFIIIIPLIVTATTNVINQLGGLNGLETIGPSIIMIGLMVSSDQAILLYAPLAVYLVLAFFNFTGKIFVGNTGSFAIGITLASFALISNSKETLLIAILPYVFNAALILLAFFFFKDRARLILEGNKLHSEHRRSLLTLIAYRRPLTERRLVEIVAVIIAVFTIIAVAV